MLQLCLQDLEPGEADVKSAKPSTFVHRPILDQVHFDKLVDSKWVTEGRQAPLFVPPAAFSRMDQPQEYQVWPVIQYFNCIFSRWTMQGLASQIPKVFEFLPLSNFRRTFRMKHLALLYPTA